MIRDAMAKIIRREEDEEEKDQNGVQNEVSTAPAANDDDESEDDDDDDDDESEDDGDILPKSSSDPRKAAMDVHVGDTPREETIDLSTNHPNTTSTAHVQPAPCPALDVPPAFLPSDDQATANPTLPTAPASCGMEFDQKPLQTAWHEPPTLPHDHSQPQSWTPLAAAHHHCSTLETPVASTSQTSGLPFPPTQC
jgi:hypothetical protein